jgi:hypothetical protein
MHRLQAFQMAARQVGFVKVNETAEGTVLWLRKNAPDCLSGVLLEVC